ncbi:MAG: DUF488 domain-containing protein [Chitinophagales bacterium]|nr:DUF488 domain-containing protein [Chitinophagales bacterium]
MSQKTIYTIGHSTRPWEEFVTLLKTHHIQVLADVRSFPSSKRYPHFNKLNMAENLPKEGIAYQHLIGLGGRRKVQPNSHNTAWRHEAFRGYADYMETEAFKEGVHDLQTLAESQPVAYMCSEATWWRCHRSMISDYLKTQGWQVLHIMDMHQPKEHPFTSPAKVVQGKLFYGEE